MRNVSPHMRIFLPYSPYAYGDSPYAYGDQFVMCQWHISNLSLSHTFTRFLACKSKTALRKKHHRHNWDYTTVNKVDKDGDGVTGYDNDDDGDGHLRR